MQFLEDTMVNLGPINFQMSLPFDLNVNDGENKFKVNISKNMAKVANFRLKIGQDTISAPFLNGPNLVIFYPILTFDPTKMINLSRRMV